jgi:hypothetical protein
MWAELEEKIEKAVRALADYWLGWVRAFLK